MNIITALSNPELHEELKKVNEFNILSKDIQSILKQTLSSLTYVFLTFFTMPDAIVL